MLLLHSRDSRAFRAYGRARKHLTTVLGWSAELRRQKRISFPRWHDIAQHTGRVAPNCAYCTTTDQDRGSLIRVGKGHGKAESKIQVLFILISVQCGTVAWNLVSVSVYRLPARVAQKRSQKGFSKQAAKCLSSTELEFMVAVHSNCILCALRAGTWFRSFFEEGRRRFLPSSQGLAIETP